MLDLVATGKMGNDNDDDDHFICREFRQPTECKCQPCGALDARTAAPRSLDTDPSSSSSSSFSDDDDDDERQPTEASIEQVRELQANIWETREAANIIIIIIILPLHNYISSFHLLILRNEKSKIQ